MFLIFITASAISYTQYNPDYHISVEAGGGYSRYLSTLNMQGLNKNGLTLSLAFLWQPEHLLEAGIETGYYYMNSYNIDNRVTEAGITDASASMVSIPVLLLFRMRVLENFRIHAGSGIMVLFNQGEIFNEEFSSSLISLTDYIGLSYNISLYKDLLIGSAFKYTYIFKLEEALITFQLTASYRIYSW